MNNPRLNAVKNLLDNSECSHILISDIIDVEYLTGFKSSNVVALVSKKKNLLISDFRYKTSADTFCAKNPEWKFTLERERLFSSLSRYIPEYSTVGIQSSSLTYDNYLEIKKTLLKVKYAKLSDEIADLFLSKKTSEIASMRKAAEIGDKALSALLPSLRPGITEFEVARKLEQLCLEYGSEKPSFDTIVLFGKRASMPHGKPANVKLRKGDWLLIDFGCTVNGFCSDMTRTFICGQANKKQIELYDIVRNAQESARSAAKAGMRSSELDFCARSQIKEHGYTEEFGHALGHGVGLRIHEKPRVSQFVESVLMENCVVTIEPGIYIPDFGGVRIEDMVVLKKNGSSVLTQFPRELMVV